MYRPAVNPRQAKPAEDVPADGRRGSGSDTLALDSMDEILNQISGLILGSIPTILFFVLLIVAYGFLVRRPLDKVLAERYARTQGAMEQARSAIGAAETETVAFEAKLLAARREISEARDARLKQWNAERERTLAVARAETQDRVRAARLELEQSAQAARHQIEAMSGELSAQILRAVLPAGTVGSEVAQ